VEVKVSDTNGSWSFRDIHLNHRAGRNAKAPVYIYFSRKLEISIIKQANLQLKLSMLALVVKSDKPVRNNDGELILTIILHFTRRLPSQLRYIIFT